MHRFSGQQRALTFVHRFLRMVDIRPTSDGEPGVTWLELLIAFELHGGKLEEAIHERAADNMARPAMTTRQLLVLFKALIRFILDTCGNELDAHFFQTSHASGTRLRALGIHHAMPSLNCMPAWSSSIAHLITQAVLRQKGRMTRAMIKSHADGCLELPWTNLTTKGIPAWRTVIAQGPFLSLQNDLALEGHNAFLPTLNRDSEFAFLFACPKCTCTRSVEKCSLLVRSGWGHILCKACHITTRSMTWRCVCGVPWHACTVHSQLVRN